uniref:(northern house mosquito) hypothetical protein n=1 Tax=Culex pipiens TaxID=7175 RepID=A0A8D8N7S6_CULPI
MFHNLPKLPRQRCRPFRILQHVLKLHPFLQRGRHVADVLRAQLLARFCVHVLFNQPPVNAVKQQLQHLLALLRRKFLAVSQVLSAFCGHLMIVDITHVDHLQQLATLGRAKRDEGRTVVTQ